VSEDVPVRDAAPVADDVRAVLEGRARFAVARGDALNGLDTLPRASVQAYVIDPPYCSGGFSETARRQAKGQGLRSETLREVGWFANDNMGTAGVAWLLRAVACEAARTLVDGGSLCVFTDWRMVANLAPALESSGLRFQNLVVWDKGAAGLGTGFRAQHELVLHFVKGTGVFHALDSGNVLRCKRTSAAARVHQTEKPVELARDILRVVAPPGGGGRGLLRRVGRDPRGGAVARDARARVGTRPAQRGPRAGALRRCGVWRGLATTRTAVAFRRGC
jgi:hypothetical protein